MKLYVLMWTDGVSLTRVEGVFSCAQNANSAKASEHWASYYVKEVSLDGGLDFKTFTVSESRLRMIVESSSIEVAKKLAQHALDIDWS